MHQFKTINSGSWRRSRTATATPTTKNKQKNSPPKPKSPKLILTLSNSLSLFDHIVWKIPQPIFDEVVQMRPEPLEEAAPPLRSSEPSANGVDQPVLPLHARQLSNKYVKINILWKSRAAEQAGRPRTAPRAAADGRERIQNKNQERPSHLADAGDAARRFPPL